MKWIKKTENDGRDWYYPSEHIKSFIGLLGHTDEDGEHEFIDVCIDHTPDSWDGFQEWRDNYANYVKFRDCVMPKTHIDIGESSIWLDNIKGPCDLSTSDNISIYGDTVIDPSSKLECRWLHYDKLNKPINKSLTNFNLKTHTTIYLEFNITTPFKNCSPIGNYSLTCTCKNPVDLLGIKNIGTLNELYLNCTILPNNVYELLMSDIKDLIWNDYQQTLEIHQLLTSINEFLQSKRKTGWMAVWEFTNHYPQFSELIPRK